MVNTTEPTAKQIALISYFLSECDGLQIIGKDLTDMKSASIWLCPAIKNRPDLKAATIYLAIS